jgi:CubicO group peptidase (beta-lactamase class C family)
MIRSGTRTAPIDLINHFATAFLLAELKGDAEAAAALAPENVSFPGIEYQAEGYAPVAAEAGLEAVTAAKIDAIVEKAMTDFPTPGLAMCVVNDGQVVYDKGFGMADVASNRTMTPQSVSTQASVSKPLTAMAIMQLVEAGVIDLDAPVTTYLPYFTMADPRYKEITPRMLLSHMSGLSEVPVKWETPLDPALDPLEQAVRSLSDQQLLAAPGKQWNYSGWGYSMLGDIIAKVSGEPYASYMQEHLLKPMGMANSTFDMAEVDPDLYVTGYISDEDGKAKPMQHFVDPRDVPNSGLWSNCEDLLRWSQFMLNAGEYEGVRVLQPESIDAMLTPVAGTFWPDIVGPWYGAGVKEYGLGWYVGDLAGHRLADHPGAGDGVNAHIQFAPDDALAVIAYNNWLDYATASWYPASFAAIDVMYALLGIEPEAETPAAQLDPDLTAQIDAMIEETMARIALPGFALAVVKDGEVAYAQGYGVTSLDGGAPVTDQTVFQWAESTMALTAMAVMQLVEEGKLDLDAPVTDYVPYFKLADERFTEITVGQLLAHTSGIPDSGDAMADWENFLPEYDGGALERWVRNDLAEKGLLFAPGEGWEYSDLGYALLGAVIGAASGQPYEAYMQEHILAPLGMDQSTFLLEEVDKALLASPHIPAADGTVAVSKAMPYHRPFAATNNLFASVADMAKLAQANLNRGELDGQQILPAGAYDVMWTATSPTPFADFPFGRVHPANMMIDWGDGWFLGDIAGHSAPNTGGGEHGFLAQMFLVPDANLAVVAVGNSQAMDEYYAADIAADVLGTLLEEGEP